MSRAPGLLPRVWVGPVSRDQVRARAEDQVVGCTGDGTGSTKRCRELAASTSLASLASRIDGPFALCAFSAGGQSVKAWSSGLDDALRSRIAAVFLFDAIYEAREPGYADPALFDWCVRATEGRVWFVATSSANPNKDHGTGIEVATWLREAVTRVTGQAWTTTPDIAIPGLAPPAAVHRLGQALFLEWPSYEHAKHPTVIAPALLELDLDVAVGASTPIDAPTAPPVWPIVVGLGVTAAAVLGIVLHCASRGTAAKELR